MNFLKQNKMEEIIDVCILHSDSFLEQYAIETMIAKTKCNLNIIEKKLEGSFADCMNELINKCSNEYVVIFQSNLLVDENWCEDLLYFSKNIVNSGCVAIYDSTNDQFKNKPLLNYNDQLQNVWMSENNIIEGLFMFKKSILNDEIGMFDKLFDNSGFSVSEFTLKIAFAGYNNFYIRKQSVIDIEIASRNEIFPKKNKDGVELINAFVKANINFNYE